MARYRRIKPEFWEDTTMASMPIPSRYLFIALLNFSDDEGFLKNDHMWIKHRCLPYDNVDIPKLLKPLFEKNRIELKNEIIKICNFKKHQKVNRPQPSDLGKMFNSKTESYPHPSKSYPQPSNLTEGLNDLEKRGVNQERFTERSVNVHGTIMERSVIDHSARVKSSQVKLSQVKSSKEKERGKKKTSLSGKEKIKFSEFVELTRVQYDLLIKEHGEDFTKRCFVCVDNYIPNRKEGPYTCYYSAIKKWVIKQVKKDIHEEKKDNIKSSNVSPSTARSIEVTQRFIERRKNEERLKLEDKKDDY